MAPAIVRDSRSATLTHARGARPLAVRALALSDDPARVFTLEGDEGLRVAERDAATFAELARDGQALPPCISALGPSNLLVSRDGRTAVGIHRLNPPGVCVVDRAAGASYTVETPGGLRIDEISWVAHDTMVAASDQREGTYLVRVRDGVLRARFPGRLIASSAGGGLIALRQRSELVLVAVDDGRELGRWPVAPARPWRLPGAISPEPLGLWCVVPDEGDSTRADVWWCEPGRPAALAGRVPCEAPIAAAGCWGDGLVLVSARCEVVVARPAADGGGLRFEWREGRRGPDALGDFEVAGFSPEGGRCVGKTGHAPVLVDLSSGDVTTFEEGPSSGVATIVGSPSGRWLGVAWRLGDVAVLAADTLADVWRFEVGDGHVFGCAFSPDERTLYALTPSRLRSWDLTTGHECAPVSLARRGMPAGRALQVSADGRLALLRSGIPDGVGSGGWTLVDLASGRVVGDLTDEAWRVGDACFSEGGDEVVAIESRDEFPRRDVRVVRLDPVGGTPRAWWSLGEDAGAREAHVEPPRLDHPTLLDHGRVMLGSPRVSSGPARYMRCDLAARTATAHEIDACVFVSEGERLGVFYESGRVTDDFATKLTLRDLATLDELAHVTLPRESPFGAATLIDADRALVVGLSDGRLLRLSVDARAHAAPSA